MGVGKVGGFPSSRSALQETLLDKEWLVDLLQRAGILAKSRGNSGQSHRATLEFVDDGQQDAVVDLVEAIAVDVKGLQGMAGYVDVDKPVALHHREISHASQERIGYTRSATTAQGNLLGRLVGNARP